MHRYTQDMPRDQRLARYLLDAAHHAVGIDRHAQRVIDRGAHGLPLRHADKVLAEQQTRAARRANAEAIAAALDAHDAVLGAIDSGEADAEALQALALHALHQLVERGDLDDDDLIAFREAEPPYVATWRQAWPDALPGTPIEAVMCRAAIGQAFIDAQRAAPEGAQPGLDVDRQRVLDWRNP
jgi:hypothetical protein